MQLVEEWKLKDYPKRKKWGVILLGMGGMLLMINLDRTQNCYRKEQRKVKRLSGILLLLLIIVVPYLWVSYAVDPQARANLVRRLS